MKLVEETGSTNRDLVDDALNGAGPGAVLIARHQTAGRGRQGRTWFDRPDSSLLMSWSVDIEASVAPLLSLVAGTAVCRAVEQFHDSAAAALKWPNDVLVPEHGGRKLVGILSEVASLPTRSDSTTGRPMLRVVVGMGMNLDLALDDAPDDVAARAVDLRTIVGHPIDRATLVDILLDHCDAAVDELIASPASALADYRTRCLTIGQRVRFETASGELSGEALSVDDDGALVLQCDDGTRRHLTAGDAHHVPPPTT